MDIINQFFHPESCDIHLNHGDLLEAIWSWAGIKPEHRQKVAEVSFKQLLCGFHNLVSELSWMYICSFPLSLAKYEASLFIRFFAPSVFRKKVKVGGDKATASTGLGMLSTFSSFPS